MAVQTRATKASETQTRGTLTPLERSAMSSLSVDKRPKTSSIAVNNPHGVVKISENGSTYAIKLTRYSTGMSGLTSNGRSLQKIMPATRKSLRQKSATKSAKVI